jgi:hypothetical protein
LLPQSAKNILLEKCEHSNPVCNQFNDDFINTYYKLHPHPPGNTNITICKVDIIPGRDLSATDINTVQNCNGGKDENTTGDINISDKNISPIIPPATKDEPKSKGLSILAIVMIIISILLVLSIGLYLILKKK